MPLWHWSGSSGFPELVALQKDSMTVLFLYVRPGDGAQVKIGAWDKFETKLRTGDRYAPEGVGSFEGLR